MKKTALLLLIPGLVLSGCNRDQVQVTRLEKTVPAAVPSGPPPIEPPAPAADAQVLRWVLPQDWTTGEAGGMRYATLLPASAGKAEVSVVMLTGSAGGELANVNRWRAQLELPPIAETELAGSRMLVRSKAGSVAVFEFANAGRRMVVGLLATPAGDTWFLKLMGEDAPTRQAKPGFLKLLGTLSLG